MSVFVKICGLCSPEDVEGVAELEPDAMGFVFWPKSKRATTPREVGAWTVGLPKSIRKVGLFVDQPMEEVMEAIQTADLDVVQLHGRETAAYCTAFDTDVWKAVHMERPLPDSLRSYPVDAFLIDSYSADSPGGTGKVGDWNKARGFVSMVEPPVLLAGGLTPRNVSRAVRTVRPWGVDVSSGVETSPGEKDMGRVKAFIEECRSL